MTQPPAKQTEGPNETFMTSSGLPLANVYTPEDSPAADYQKKIGDPGNFPFTRGIYPDMYHGRLWTMRQYAGYGSAEETNARFLHLLKSGQTGLSVAFDLPTQMGYDPDDPKALGEVGRVGVSIASLDDLERLLRGIPLDQVSTSMTINATAPILLAFYAALGEKQGLDRQSLAGTMQNDILKEYIARGTYVYPVSFSMRMAIDLIEYCVRFIPKMNPISISGYHMREAGATAAQEIAFTFANAISYLEEAGKRGLAPDDLGGRISFFFACHNHFFEEIAKFRAARRLWATLMRERFGAQNPKALMLRFHTQTGGSTLTSRHPMNNVVRVALQAMAAVLGGTQSLHTNAFDEALALPTQESATLALRTQQILAHETGVPKVADPLGGSYYVEALTDQLLQKSTELLKEVESQGGALACIRSGYFQTQIHQSAYTLQQQMESGQSTVVGVNAFTSEETASPAVLKIDPRIEEDAARRIRKLREGRNAASARAALADIKRSAQGKDNLIPFFIKGVSAGLTLGEICGTLRDLFGEYDTGTFDADPQS